jgi:hypothetical protein
MNRQPTVRNAKKNALVAYKTFFSLLGFSAIVTEIATVVALNVFDPGKFFSFFTIESNILAFVALLLSALGTAQGGESRSLDMVRGAATLYMVVTGLVFAVLLSGIKNIHFTAVPWDNTVLHYIMPVAVFVDWLVDTPRRILFKRGLIWLVFPVVYLVYSLVRGPLVNWYPYPFLDPNINGYLSVAVTSLGVTVLGVALIGLLVWLTKTQVFNPKKRLP